MEETMETVLNDWAIREARGRYQIWYFQAGAWHRQGYDNYTEPDRASAIQAVVNYAQD